MLRIGTVVLAVAIGCAAVPASAGGFGAPAYVSVVGGSGLSLLGEGAAVAVVGARGLAVVSDHVQLGGTLLWRGEWPDGHTASRHALVVAATGRFGAPVAAPLWLGFGFDVGLTVWRKASPRSDPHEDIAVTADAVSAYLFPGFVLVFLHPVGPVTLGFEAQLGFEVIAGGSYEERGSDWTGVGTLLSAAAAGQLGVSLGF